MPNLYLEGIDRAELVAEIAAAVVAELRGMSPAPDGATQVDGDRMAQIAGVSRPTLDRLVKRDAIPSRKVGRLRRFVPDEVLAAMKAGASDAN